MTEKHIPLFFFITSAGMLGGALVSQYFFGLSPCELCIYQRWPHFIIMILAYSAFLKPHFARLLFIVIGLTYLIGASIAFFHTGVEQSWWEGLSGCSTPDFAKADTIEDLMEMINNAPVVTCGEIAFSFLGLSMAAWNAVLSLLLGIASLILPYANPISTRNAD